MGAGGVDRSAGRIAGDLDQAEDLADVALLEQTAVEDGLRPDTREAVGLQLELRRDDPRGVEQTEQVLHAVRVLVCDHDRGRGVPNCCGTLSKKTIG